MIELKHVSKKFGQKLAVDDMNLVVQPGHIMGLIGQNGAGKTTTFRMLLNFIDPTTGSINWDGHPIDDQMRAKIGFLPEERGLYQKLSIEEQVLYFAELHGMKRSTARIELKNWMQRLEVVGALNDKVQKLSKGNAQKIQLIATLIFHPDFVILDEPFTGMDPVNTEIVMQEIKQLKQQGATIIFSSHNMAGVEQLSDELTMLRAGKTVLQGSLNGIRESFGRTEIYIESDVSNAQLQLIDGVKSIESRGIGRQVHLTKPKAGQAVFDLVSADGYVSAFAQQAPTLDEIFRREATEGKQE
ncbi:ABC transporter ATP-binding protein [Weissella coleopterorum]|uniref:ABC transporter ATP-binding protein n=1 Tax=Weissella coleopterorum TaxID=2714949 RepID=A0A6G8B029_9LACO|nr:ABC transporter ATP-binding protein [Weissella coleopterorum]QIL50701.1 ABC transporter ATP-binding protein [Weissella coleopterorum]